MKRTIRTDITLDREPPLHVWLDATAWVRSSLESGAIEDLEWQARDDQGQLVELTTEEERWCQEAVEVALEEEADLDEPDTYAEDRDQRLETDEDEEDDDIDF